MENSCYKKTFVFGIIVLFIGAGVFPAKGIVKNNDNVFENQNYIKTELKYYATTVEDDEWHQFKHDAQGTGYINSTGPENPTLIWKFYLGFFPALSSPIIADGKVYMTSSNEVFYCFDAFTGFVLWKYSLPGGTTSASAAYYNGKVYQGAVYNYTYCWNATTGELIWKFDQGYGVISSPAVYEGKVYILKVEDNRRGRFYCLNAENGIKIWDYYFGTESYSSPAVYEGKVYIGSGRGNVTYCFDAENGSILWKKSAGGIVYSSPAVADGKVYIGGGKKLWCLNATTGEDIWIRNYEMIGYASPSVVDGKIYICYDGGTMCLSTKTGDRLWENSMSYKWGTTAVCSGRLYICYEEKGSVVCLSPINGKKLWEKNIEEPGYPVGHAAVAYNRLYLSAGSTGFFDPYLYCFEDSNLPPDPPTIDGPTSGKAGTEYNYTFKTVDPDEDEVYYYIKWGDGHFEIWDGPHPSGVDFEIAHTYARQGTYIIQAKAKDIFDAESGWSKLEVSMPRNRATYTSLFLRLLDQFPILSKLLYLIK